MPSQPVKEDDDESWTQTFVTVTPEELATIRTIVESTLISAIGGTALELGVNQIAERRTVPVDTIRRDLFISVAELEEGIGHNDAECQTFLQGVAKLELPAAYKDEATQTIYLGKFCPRPLQDIERILNDRITPTAEKRTEATQTVVTFEPEASRNYIVDRLSEGATPEELQRNYEPEEAISAAACVADNLYFVIDRVLWLSDPDYDVPKIAFKDEAAQTFIKYDYGLGKIVLDADTQTSLTCEPKRSNAGLLSDWSATKEFAQSIIDECIETGVRPRSVVDSIIAEVVDKCASQIRLPYKDKAVQTYAACNALKDKDDVVLRKLRLGVVLDTLESSIIVLPVIQILLERTCLEIRRDAPVVAAEIANRIQRNSATIASRLAAIRKEAVSHKPIMDDIFDARKKRLKELLRNDKTAKKPSSGTQTELAGVPDIMKVKEPKETVCSTCVRHSDCFVCKTSRDNELENPATEKGEDGIFDRRILRTQDILIAYNPCYLVATPSEIPKKQPIVRKRPRPRPLSTADLRAAVNSSSTSCEPKNEENRPQDVRPRVPRSLKLKGESRGGSDSLNDWGRVVQESSSISGVWSIRGSSSADVNTVSGQLIEEGAAGTSSTCVSRSVKALRILKNTFNRKKESCCDCTYVKVAPVHGETSKPCSTCDTRGGDSSRKTRAESEDHEKLRTSARSSSENKCEGGVRVVPIIHLANEMK